MLNISSWSPATSPFRIAVSFCMKMARCKNTKRQRPDPKRGQSTPVTLNRFGSPPETPATPIASATANGATDSASVTSGHASVYTPQADGTPSAVDATSICSTPTSQRQPSSNLKTQRAYKAPFLASSLVGNKTSRVAIQEPGNTKRTIMSFCVDCVRPHLYLYCDGTKELKTHLCDFHTEQ